MKKFFNFLLSLSELHFIFLCFILPEGVLLKVLKKFQLLLEQILLSIKLKTYLKTRTHY